MTKDRGRETEEDTIVIRPLHLNDHTPLAALLGDAAPHLDDFASYAAEACAYVAEQNDAIIGVLLAQPLAYDGNAPLTIWVDTLFVHIDQRRRGVATALYQTLATQARIQGVKGILTRLTLDDHAVRLLHQRLGFQVHIEDTVVWRLV